MRASLKTKQIQTQRGFAYIVLLFLVAAISVTIAIVSQDEATLQMREKERDWLFIGHQYQQAIKRYYEKSPDGIKTLPNNIDDLVLDSRFIKPVHHLRKPYLDPLTGKEWALIRNEEGFLIGVNSESANPVFLQQMVSQLIESSSAISQHTDVKFVFKVDDAESEDSNENQEIDNLDSVESEAIVSQ